MQKRRLLPPGIVSTLVLALATLGIGVTANAATLTGVVQLGGTALPQPLSDVAVTLYEATTGEPTLLGQAETDDSGQFTIESSVQTSASILFVTADVALGVQFVAVLGTDLPASVTINELTSVAACYATAQFFRSGQISGDPFGLRIAAGMNDNIVDTTTGQSSTVLLSSPNADQTNSLRLTRSLANLLQATVRFPLARLIFLQLTRPHGGTFPPNTAVGLANLARDPARHARLISLLSMLEDAYRPALQRRPDAWTVTVKVHDTGDDSILFGGPGNVSFDSRGYAWLTNNVVQGTPVSATTIVVLQPNGRPAVGGPGLPTSPISGGGILGTGWGVGVDPFDQVWYGNFGWGMDDPTMEPTDPNANGSVSLVSSDGTPLSTPVGFFGDTFRVQAVESDSQGNIWIASFGNGRVVYFPGGDSSQSQMIQLYEGSGPFGVAIDATGAAWVTNSGGLGGRNPSSIGKYFINSEGQIEQQFLHFLGDTLKVVQIDSLGNAWFTSQGTDTLYAFRPDGTPFKRHGFQGGGMDGPWGLAIDGEDNIWVSNFGQVALGNFNDGGLSKFAGANAATRPPGTKLGDPLTPATGYTLPSAGAPVRLANGELLNGPGSLPVFAPLMRQTSVQIDQAGNCWTINNYKPRFSTDVLSYNDGHLTPADANPGGDGIVIFVGLAPPPALPFP